MKIAVAGTGCVGLSVATFLSWHHQVKAVDIILEKATLINDRQSPIQGGILKNLEEKDLNLIDTLDAKVAYSNADRKNHPLLPKNEVLENSLRIFSDEMIDVLVDYGVYQSVLT